MNRDQIIELSPVRTLDRGLRGGLGAGRLGVLMARAGAGRTAMLCHLGVDALLRGRPVLHVALAADVADVGAWYGAIIDDVLTREPVDDIPTLRHALARDRVVKALPRRELTAAELDAVLALLEGHMQFRPALVLIDGFDWRGAGAAGALAGFKAIAGTLGAELWMTVESHIIGPGLAAPCAPHAATIDAAIRLEPRGPVVRLELVPLGMTGIQPSLGLELQSDTLRLVGPGTPSFAVRTAPLAPAVFSLLSGGAAGAEAEFGAGAERYGLAELTFTFPGRIAERTRGLIELAEDELAQGAVSSVELEQQMRRTYPDTPIFRRVVQSIWHQVATAAEVFAVGDLQDDGTVRGGTGWAVELARHWDKPVTVFDQPRARWVAWVGRGWQPIAPPRITYTRFCGTGTRLLTDAGRAAIAELYQRSFEA
jgi:hypothetical protein